MDLAACLKKMELVGVLAFATVDSEGAPQIRNISAIHYEPEYFNLGVNPIFRETYILGNVSIKEKGYYITESCIGCGICMKHCPQKCIEKGTPFVIWQEHCLHCGNCYENCPVKAVIRK